MSILKRVYYIPNANAGQKWLCQVLNTQNITQTELAKRLHTTRQSVCKLLNGQTKLTFEKICAICYVCDYPAVPEEVWNWINWNWPNAQEH